MTSGFMFSVSEAVHVSLLLSSVLKKGTVQWANTLSHAWRVNDVGQSPYQDQTQHIPPLSDTYHISFHYLHVRLFKTSLLQRFFPSVTKHVKSVRLYSLVLLHIQACHITNTLYSVNKLGGGEVPQIVRIWPEGHKKPLLDSHGHWHKPHPTLKPTRWLWAQGGAP